MLIPASNYLNQKKYESFQLNLSKGKQSNYKFKPDSTSFTSKLLILPKKDINEILQKTYNDILRTQNIQEKKQLITEVSNKKLRTLLWDIKPHEMREDYETNLLAELAHDQGNLFHNVVNKNTNEEINEALKTAKTFFLETIDNYQLMFNNKGLRDKNLQEVFNFSLNMLKSKAKQAKVSIKAENIDLLTKDFKGGMPKNDFYSIFHNLIDNSIKYSPENTSIKIKFETAQRTVENPASFVEKNGEKIYFPDIPKERKQKGINFIVEDEGIGIKKEDIQKVLNGERAENAVKSGKYGTGFGLEKIKRILNRNNIVDDNIKIESPISKQTPNSQSVGTKITCFIADMQY
ncbi:MAG: hypothetical protein LBK53_08260 [Heliobacteriaceae bacterium]|jgi:signal transduction histidine kinase|nr:hypothetical protein [Heliobacteriaceae bacterium]